MKRSPLLIISAGALVGGLLLVVYLVSRTTATASPDQREQQADQENNIASGNAAEVSALRREINSLRAQVGVLRGDMSKTQAAVRAEAKSAPPDEPKDTRTYPQRMADDARRFHEYMSGVAGAFRDEAVDSQWSARSTAAVRKVLAGDNPLNKVVQDVECRSHSCRIAFEDEGKADLNKQLPLFVNQLGDTLPYMLADRVQEADGRSSMILYMSTRQEQPTPPSR